MIGVPTHLRMRMLERRAGCLPFVLKEDDSSYCSVLAESKIPVAVHKDDFLCLVV